jgi:type IV pilus assembly protein PilO
MANLNVIGESLSGQFQGLKGRHPGQWPLIPRILCAIAVMIAVIAVGWSFYWSGQIDEQEKGEQKETKLKGEYQVKIQQAVNLNELRKQKEQVKDYVSSLEKQLPGKAQIDALLSEINAAGAGRGLHFDLFKPGAVVVRDYYAELPIDLKINGNYHDIGAFTGDIANLSRIVTLNNLSLTANKDGAGLTMEAVAKTFRYLDSEELAAGRKEAADKKKQQKGEKK